MTFFVWSRWRSLSPRVRSWLVGLTLGVPLLAAVVMHPVLILVGPALFVLFMAGGIASALLEIRRDRRTARESRRLAC